MKHKIHLISLICMLMCVETGCSTGEIQEHSSVSTNNINDNSQSTCIDSSMNDRLSLETIEVTPSTYCNDRNRAEWYTTDELEHEILENTNYKLSKNFYSHVPKEIETIYTFVKYYPEADAVYDLCNDFFTLYKYLYPFDALNERNLFYFGVNSNNQRNNDDVKNYNENYEELMSESPTDIYYLFYSPYFQPSQLKNQTEENHFLELGNPVGYSLTNFNKGALSKYVSSKEVENDKRFLETFTNPAKFSAFDSNTGEYAGYPRVSYAVSSTDSIKMTDGKEMRICDAVEYYENYINSLPLSRNPDLDIRCKQVISYEIGENNECALYFLTEQVYAGIPFDIKPNGLHVIGGGDDNYEQYLSMGYMSQTDDVDAAYGFGRYMCAENIQEYHNIVSLKDALKCCYDSMSDYTQWEILSAELVYCAKRGKMAEPPHQGVVYNVKPCYKFVIYNEIDSLEYAVYIDSLTCELERYYKAKGYRME